MADQTVYIKLGRNGDLIERVAVTPADHVQLRGTGWVVKDSEVGKQVAKPTKGNDVSDVAPTSVAIHAAAATVTPSTPEATTKASPKS